MRQGDALHGGLQASGANLGVLLLTPNDVQIGGCCRALYRDVLPYVHRGVRLERHDGRQGVCHHDVNRASRHAPLLTELALQLKYHQCSTSFQDLGLLFYRPFTFQRPQLLCHQHSTSFWGLNS